LLTTVGQFDEADDLLAAVEREIEPSDAPLWSPAVPIVSGLLHLAAGRRGQAVAEATAGLALAQRLGTGAFLPLGHWILAGKAIDDGNLAQAAHHVALFRAEPPAIEGPMGAGNYRLTEACFIEARDGPTAALKLIYALAEDPSALRRLLLAEPTAAAFMVRTATAAGDSRMARTVVDAAELLAVGNPEFIVVGAAAAQARGLFDQDRGQLEQAMAGHRHPWARASATEDLATLLADSNPAAARMYYEQAATRYEEVGATRDVARTCARHRAVRITRQRRSRYDLPPSGWGSLTSREIHVTRLVAQGLSNPQVAASLFLSRHTVDFHLRQIFRKLGISSRVELARIYVDHEPGGSDYRPEETL
jgi:DNA-binding CsgD family transcriptional regulator